MINTNKLSDRELSEEEELYKENILDHYRYPRNNCPLEDATVKERAFNPLCGDDITIYIKADEEKVVDVSFTGQGCAISQASISMVTEKIKGMKLNHVKLLDQKAVLEMLGIPISYQRKKCALLSLKVVHQGIEILESKNK
jgi:nitrogen fixation protein NifU and related proteins